MQGQAKSAPLLVTSSGWGESRGRAEAPLPAVSPGGALPLREAPGTVGLGWLRAGKRPSPVTPPPHRSIAGAAQCHAATETAPP